MADVVTVPGGASTKRVLAAAMTLILTVLTAVVIAAPAADAHGAPTRPGSRTYLCRVDGTHASGDIQPDNPACDAAVQLGGKQPLWDWFGVLRGDGAGRTRGYIPDGQLCSGGEPKYAGYDLARADWPYTRLTAGDEMVMRYNAWAAHPGEIRLYVTRDGYDPTKPLGWDDLEPEPFSVYRQDQPNGQDEVNQTPDYQWPVTLPQKSGPHIIYSIWERSDSQETFYGCSDVRFDGGSGEVIGIGPGATVVGAPSGQTANAMADTGPATTVAPGGAIPAETPAAAGQTESADGVEPPMAGNAPEASDAATGATAQPADESSTAGAGPSSSPAAGSDGTGGATSLASAEADTTTSDAGAAADQRTDALDPAATSTPAATGQGLGLAGILAVGLVGIALGSAVTIAIQATRRNRELSERLARYDEIRPQPERERLDRPGNPADIPISPPTGPDTEPAPANR